MIGFSSGENQIGELQVLVLVLLHSVFGPASFVADLKVLIKRLPAL